MDWSGFGKFGGNHSPPAITIPPCWWNATGRRKRGTPNRLFGPCRARTAALNSRRKRAIFKMLKITEIAFTCYPVTDMARARKFYEGVLGLKPTMLVGEPGGMQWTEYDIASGTLSLGAGAPDWKPTPTGCSVGLEMEDFDAAIAHLKANGVKFKMEPFPTPVCQMAFIYDTEGNLICIHKRHATPHAPVSCSTAH